MMRRTRPTAAGAGFTFVELLIVTIMIGLLAAIGIPAFLGQRNKAEGATAQSLLRSAATTVESAAVEPTGYPGVTTAALAGIEPNVVWTDAPGALAADAAVTVSDLGDAGYTLSTTTPSGQTFTLVKDATAVPTVTRTCGPGCTW